MELRQLEYVVTVAEEASFTRAAARLNVAQPGVSAQVRRLERELGEILLDRSGGQVTTTDVGAAVLVHARVALAAVQGVRETVQELTGLTRGRVRMGTVSASGAFGVADLLAQFHAAHPGVEISLLEDDSAGLLRGVTGGALDLALVGVSGPAPTGVERQVIVEDRLMAAVHRAHPLAGRGGVSLRTVAEEPLVCVPRGTGMRAALDDGCRAIGVQPRIAFEAADPIVLAQLAARGLGVAILPESAAGIDPGVAFVPVARPQMRSRIELAWRAEGALAPAARALVAAARAFFADGRDRPRTSA